MKDITTSRIKYRLQLSINYLYSFLAEIKPKFADIAL